MLVERILGNVEADAYAFSSPPRMRDELEIRWWELDRRALRKTTRCGWPVRVLLPLGQALTDGDVLFDDGKTLVVLSVAPAEVLVVRPRDTTEMGIVALVVGNLHAPAEVIGGQILIVPDGPVEAALHELGVVFERQVCRFRPRLCAGMPTLQVSSGFEVRS
jgi:urease accessory protein